MTYSILQLKEIEPNTTVAIRGFLYKNDAGWILADNPQLKSCCIGKLENQILIIGNVDKFSHYPVFTTLEGKLRTHPYELRDAKVLTTSSSSSFWLFALTFSLGILVFTICSKRPKN